MIKEPRSLGDRVSETDLTHFNCGIAGLALPDVIDVRDVLDFELVMVPGIRNPGT